MIKKDSDNMVFAGVFGGIGRSIGVDPFWLRLAFVLATIFGVLGTGWPFMIVLYAIMCFIMPSDN